MSSVYSARAASRSPTRVHACAMSRFASRSWGSLLALRDGVTATVQRRDSTVTVEIPGGAFDKQSTENGGYFSLMEAAEE